MGRQRRRWSGAEEDEVVMAGDTRQEEVEQHQERENREEQNENENDSNTTTSVRMGGEDVEDQE